MYTLKFHIRCNISVFNVYKRINLKKYFCLKEFNKRIDIPFSELAIILHTAYRLIKF